MKNISIDFSDHRALVDLMDRHEEFPQMLSGKNGDGEIVCTSILEDQVILETFQMNGWTRKNYFYRDGTREELYEMPSCN